MREKGIKVKKEKGGGVRERNAKKDSGLLNFIENICKEGIIRPVVR